MANRLSGQRYAQAIFELALENQQLEQWDQDLRLAADVLGDDEFALFLGHADVPQERKIAAIEAVLSEAHPLVQNLVSLLVSRGGVDAMRDVQEGYSRLLDDHLGRQRVEITTAVPLELFSATSAVAVWPVNVGATLSSSLTATVAELVVPTV